MRGGDVRTHTARLLLEFEVRSEPRAQAREPVGEVLATDVVAGLERRREEGRVELHEALRAHFSPTQQDLGMARPLS